MFFQGFYQNKTLSLSPLCSLGVNKPQSVTQQIVCHLSVWIFENLANVMRREHHDNSASTTCSDLCGINRTQHNDRTCENYPGPFLCQ